MLRQFIILNAFIILSASANAKTNIGPNSDFLTPEIEKLELELDLFGNQINTEIVSIASLDIYNVEEEVALDFNTENYLPEDFSAYVSLTEKDLFTLALYKTEEELNVNISNSKKDRNRNFLEVSIEMLEMEDALFGNQFKTEIVSSASLYVYEVEETISLNIDVSKYLPEGFNAQEGMNDLKGLDIELYETEEEIDLGFDTQNYLPKNFNPYQGMTSPQDQEINLNVL